MQVHESLSLIQDLEWFDQRDPSMSFCRACTAAFRRVKLQTQSRLEDDPGVCAELTAVPHADKSLQLTQNAL